ncbi:phage holin family protein [Bacillus horti]|uniref:Holin n=1 Tax=Caldalkalibacillus horti TaxID=77523 RepID=A0ABT9W4J7_9BACI|nr:phage holin family protein [Bacillus horti]MDQ0168172.1 hypothetical protein [Bacillus horti]
MDFVQFIREEMYILIPVLWTIGHFLKMTPYVKSWLLPWILLVIGCVFSILLLGFNIQAIIQGILVTGGAVLTHELFKQTSMKIQGKV